MNKKRIVSALEILKRSLESQIAILKSNSAKERKGTVYVKKEHGVNRIYVVDKSGRGKTRYLGKKDKQEIRSYAQKRYNLHLLRNAELEKDQMDKCLKALEPEADIENVFDSMPEALKPYITANESTDLGYAQRWQASKVQQSKRLIDGEGYPTMRGEFVRSKSEVIIADRLFKAGIPYRYEIFFPMEYEDVSYVFPDFQILNTRTKEVFLWEHMGMMSDPEYLDAQLKKISGYARNGYILGKNLIVSFESKRRPLDILYVDQVIKAFLL
ncbi:MAG: hypothetical protein IJ863_01920 [Spirochaetales bacterium]|nr:hypothetical protein [Spirochaetales bacterium]